MDRDNWRRLVASKYGPCWPREWRRRSSYNQTLWSWQHVLHPRRGNSELPTSLGRRHNIDERVEMTVIGDWSQTLAVIYLTYDAASPCSVLNMRLTSLHSTRRRTGNQCISLRTDVMCSRRPDRLISLPAAFCTDRSCRYRLSVPIPYSTALQ